MFYRIQYLLFPGNDKKSVFFPNRLAATKRASIRGPRYRGKFDDICAYIQTYIHILKRGLLRAHTVMSSAWIGGLRGNNLVVVLQARSVFCEHRNEDCWKSYYYTSLSYPRIAVHINDRSNELKNNIDVTWFVICDRISKRTPNLNMNGNQSLILFLIHHPNQRWNNSRWVINFY